MGSLGDRLIATGGRPNGFDYLRIILACLVIAFHSVASSYGSGYADYVFSKPGFHAGSMLILPMFFSLSGFLVAGSLERNRSVIGFLGLRAIRIYPALTVEVLLSAFVLGVLFTDRPLGAYFSDHLFLRYLWNVTGDISYLLPGVFERNPNPLMVNRQLWTVPFELYCYLSLTALMLLGLPKRPRLFALMTIGLQALHLSVRVRWPAQQFAGHLDGTQLIFSFLVGVSLYLNRDAIPFRRSWAMISAGLSLLLFSFQGGEYLAVFSAAYLTVFLGLLNPRKISIMRGADYSYGVYLYGWPIQQAIVATGSWARHWWVNIPVSLACAALFAALSWHIVEKPALRLRTPLKKIEARWLKWRASLSPASAEPLTETA